MRNSLAFALLLTASIAAGPAVSDQPVPVPGDVAGWLAERDRVLAEFGTAPPAAGSADAWESGVPVQIAAGEPQVVGSDVRLALTQMALAAGSAGQAEIAAAQPADGPGAIYLRGGSATLDQLLEATRGTALEPALRQNGGAYVASRPIVVLQGAELRLLPGEVLELDTESGAFLLNFGHLSISGATVRAHPPAPGREDGFRPFVASLGTGTLDVSWGVFVGLGSRVAPAATGLALSAGSLFAASGGASVVRDSRFIDVHGLSVIDGDGAAVIGNRFDHPRGVAIYVDDSQDVKVRGNFVQEPQGHFAARIDGPGEGVTFVDNVLVGGEHAGLRIAGGVASVDLRGNVVSGFAGRGIVAEEGASCLRAARNLIRGNGGDGISARDIGTMVVMDNAILDNGGAGVSLARSRPEAELLLANNLLAGNRSGVRTATVGALWLTGNEMSGQMPRHLAGDLTQHTPLYLAENRRGARAALAFEHVVAEVVEPLSEEALQGAFERCQGEEGT